MLSTINKIATFPLVSNKDDIQNQVLQAEIFENVNFPKTLSSLSDHGGNSTLSEVLNIQLRTLVPF